MENSQYFLLFVCFWFAVLFLISLAGGWLELGRHYRYQGRMTGARKHMQFGSLRWGVGYNGCLSVGANYEGLYLAVWLLFRPWHPPLLIPWNDITFNRRKILGVPVLELSFAQAPRVPLRLSRNMETFLKAASGRDLRFGEAV
jgi:hypothetical protein